MTIELAARRRNPGYRKTRSRSPQHSGLWIQSFLSANNRFGNPTPQTGSPVVTNDR
jgi:hypothetical protein